MRILFISRKYPPVIGGMENYAFNLHQEFIKAHDVVDIILKKRQIHLLWFYPWIFIKGLFLILTKKIDLVYVGDGVLVSVAWIFQTIFRKKTVLTIHGLDVIYDLSIYQAMIKLFLPRINNVVANSRATKHAAIERGVTPENVVVIPVGVTWPESPDEKSLAHNHINSKLSINTENCYVMTTVGRLVERKGVRWFVAHVMPQLEERFCFLIAGDGADKAAIQLTIDELGLGDRVELLGRIDDQAKHHLLQISDVFLSPNIAIEGDMEGFGIVNLEAGTFGVPVVAAAVDGVKDAVIDGQTGYLVDERDAHGFISAIKKTQDMRRQHISELTKSTFGWQKIYQQYMDFIVD